MKMCKIRDGNEKFACHEFQRLSCNIKLTRKSVSRKSELFICEKMSIIRHGSATSAWYWWIDFVQEYMKYISSRCMGIVQLLSTETNSNDWISLYDYVKISIPSEKRLTCERTWSWSMISKSFVFVWCIELSTKLYQMNPVLVIPMNSRKSVTSSWRLISTNLERIRSLVR